MNSSWAVRKLSDIAEIRVSNVDKKTHPREKPVKLCNYMDVYSNEYITNGLDFMEASATTAEIERFSLDCGDVVITKDSETPDDIGIATVIAEPIDRLVCGYHLALIRPNADQLDSVYLAKQLSTSPVARYFALRASGSTRYGLPRSTIESVSIPTPPKPEQTKIAEILSTVDRAIEQTQALIAKQQRIKTGLMQDLLIRGIDEHGNLRSESTHKFKDCPLGRIPEEWEVEKFERRIESSAFGPRFPATAYSESGNIAMLRTTDLDKFGNIAYGQMPRARLDTKAFEPHFLKQGDLLISRSGTVGIPAVFDSFDVPVIPGAFLIRFRMKRETAVPAYWRAYFNWAPGRHRLVSQSEGGVQKNLRGSSVHKMLMALPKVGEQRQAVSILNAFDSEVETMQRYLSKLQSTKNALMQDLLTGKKRVTLLLESELKREKMYAQR